MRLVLAAAALGHDLSLPVHMFICQSSADWSIWIHDVTSVCWYASPFIKSLSRFVGLYLVTPQSSRDVMCMTGGLYVIAPVSSWSKDKWRHRWPGQDKTERHSLELRKESVAWLQTWPSLALTSSFDYHTNTGSSARQRLKWSGSFSRHIWQAACSREATYRVCPHTPDPNNMLSRDAVCVTKGQFIKFWST